MAFDSLNKLFRDLPSERVELLTSKCHLFLQDDPTANIIRRPSQSLRESICRDLVESGQLDSYPTTFRFTAFLISRDIRDRETIEELFDQRLLTYKEFESEQPKVERLISSAKIHYFEKRKDIPDNIKSELWEKLEAAWSGLSIKQRSALEIHIMSDDPVSLEKGAKRLKISKASFKERVQSGIRKIEKAMPPIPFAQTAGNSYSQKRIVKTKQFKRRADAPNSQALYRVAANPESPLSPFSEANKALRLEALKVFQDVVSGSKDSFNPQLKKILPEYLWLYQMGVILFWIYNSSENSKKTFDLIDKTVPLIAYFNKQIQSPFAVPVRSKILSILKSFAPDLGQITNPIKEGL